VFKKTLARPRKPELVRRRLTTLVWQGLEFDADLLGVLKDGYKLMLKADYGPEVAFVTRRQAEEYLARAKTFLIAAKTVCD